MWISRKDYESRIKIFSQEIERRDAVIELLYKENAALRKGLEDANKMIFLADSIFKRLSDRAKERQKESTTSEEENNTEKPE